MAALNNITAELKNILQVHGWSQEDLARELGVSFATVNRWENGKAVPSKLAAIQLEKIFAGKAKEKK